MGGNPVFRVLPGIRLELAFPRSGGMESELGDEFLKQDISLSSPQFRLVAAQGCSKLDSPANQNCYTYFL
jgi:hypothetical protein